MSNVQDARHALTQLNSQLKRIHPENLTPSDWIRIRNNWITMNERIVKLLGVVEEISDSIVCADVRQILDHAANNPGRSRPNSSGASRD